MKFLFVSGVLVACLLGLGLAAPQLQSPPDFWQRDSAGENSTTIRPFAEDCQQYCSYTYPEHTYPQPSNFKACTTGCRSAQLDAFISWPLQTNSEKCEAACQEIYSDEDQQYACSTGCKTPTIDSAFPNRDHLYSEEGNWTSEVSFMPAPISETISYFFRSFFGNPVGFEDLNEHAQNMEVLVVPYLRSDVTILTNDGVYSYREYSFDNGDPIFVPPDMEGGSSSIFPMGVEQGSYRHASSSNCVWLLHRTALKKMLFILAVGLIVAALVTFLLSACNTRTKVRPKVSAMKTSPPLPVIKKAPYDLGSEFVLPEKIKLDNVKITML